MQFSQLLGNEQLKKNLQVSLEKGRTSHFYLISGPEGSGKHTLAKLLSAATSVAKSIFQLCSLLKETSPGLPSVSIP